MSGPVGYRQQSHLEVPHGDTPRELITMPPTPPADVLDHRGLGEGGIARRWAISQVCGTTTADLPHAATWPSKCHTQATHRAMMRPQTTMERRRGITGRRRGDGWALGLTVGKMKPAPTEALTCTGGVASVRGDLEEPTMSCRKGNTKGDTQDQAGRIGVTAGSEGMQG